MSEEEAMDNNIIISFRIGPTLDFRRSSINTIVCLLKEIIDLEDNPSWEENDSFIMNDRIEMIKRELDNLRCIEYKEE